MSVTIFHNGKINIQSLGLANVKWRLLSSFNDVEERKNEGNLKENSFGTKRIHVKTTKFRLNDGIKSLISDVYVI